MGRRDHEGLGVRIVFDFVQYVDESVQKIRIETVFTALTLHSGIIPPTINLENPSEDCDLDYVPNVARKKKITYAMTNSFGFGGTNATLVLKKFTST